MRTITLAKGQTLWRQGDPCTTIAAVEKGSLAVWSEKRLVAVLLPPAVFGETALAALEGHSPNRLGTVIALEDVRVTEYPVSFVRDAFGTGLHRQVLRSLIGQICRNALLVIAANPGQPVADFMLVGLIRSMAECEEQLAHIKTWDSFLVLFRMLCHVRDATDRMRIDLVTHSGDAFLHTVTEAGDMLRGLFKTADKQQYVQQFIEAERQRVMENP